MLIYINMYLASSVNELISVFKEAQSIVSDFPAEVLVFLPNYVHGFQTTRSVFNIR